MMSAAVAGLRSIRPTPSYTNPRDVTGWGDLRVIEPLALELRHVPLEDAATMLALYAQQRPEKFERARLKWLARFSTEKAAGTEDVGYATDCLALMPDDPQEALQRLRRLL